MGHYTVLVVDDNKDTLTLLDTELSYEGFRVIQAHNGRDAFLKAQNFLPDLVLMDIVMPDMNGGQAIKMLKDNPKTKNIPVIFLTAMLTKEEEKLGQAGISVEGTTYPTIAKPFTAEELMSEINKVMHIS